MTDIPVDLTEEQITVLVASGFATIEGTTLVLTDMGNAWLRDWIDQAFREHEERTLHAHLGMLDGDE